MPSKKSVKVSLVTSGTQKWEKKVEDFLFLPHWITNIKALLYITYRCRVHFDTFLVNLQLINVLTPGMDGRRFLAYSLQSMYIKRCDRPLQCLTAPGGREVRFRGFWSTPETVDQSKQVWFVCVLFSVFLRCIQNSSSLAWLFFFLNISAKVQKWYTCQFD